MQMLKPAPPFPILSLRVYLGNLIIKNHMQRLYLEAQRRGPTSSEMPRLVHSDIHVCQDVGANLLAAVILVCCLLATDTSLLSPCETAEVTLLTREIYSSQVLCSELRNLRPRG